MTEAPEAAPEPTMNSVQLAPIVVAAPEIPVTAHHNPPPTGPALEDAVAVEVVANAPESAPHPAPMALVVAVESAQAVEVHANALVISPAPLRLAMELVVVALFAPKVPVRADLVPRAPSKRL